MNRWLKRVLVGAGVIAASLGVVVAIGTAKFSMSMNETYDVSLPALSIPSSTVAISRGLHLAQIGGCIECHGSDLGGKVVIDEPPIGKIVATNLTRGKGGVADQYDDMKWDRAIRNGIGADDKPLYFMPSGEYYFWADADVAALIAYLKSVPPVDRTTDENQVLIVGKMLEVFGMLPINHARRIDQAAARPAAPPAGPTAEYGRVLSMSCLGCHGEGFAGGPIPGAPPTLPVPTNLTFHETGLAKWSEADFAKALREGVRPDGSKIDPFMPIGATKHLTDDEIRAIWLFLGSRPKQPFGAR